MILSRSGGRGSLRAGTALVIALVIACATSPAFADKCKQAKKAGNQAKIAKFCKASGGSAVDAVRTTPPARGSWVKSCRNSSQIHGYVSAECKAVDGTWSQTSANYTKCPGFSLTNLNGNLVCGP